MSMLGVGNNRDWGALLLLLLLEGLLRVRAPQGLRAGPRAPAALDTQQARCT